MATKPPTSDLLELALEVLARQRGLNPQGQRWHIERPDDGGPKWEVKQSELLILGGNHGKCRYITWIYLEIICRIPDMIYLSMKSVSVFTWLVVGPPKPEKYEFVNWDDDINSIFLGKCQIDGNQSPPTSHWTPPHPERRPGLAWWHRS